MTTARLPSADTAAAGASPSTTPRTLAWGMAATMLVGAAHAMTAHAAEPREREPTREPDEPARVAAARASKEARLRATFAGKGIPYPASTLFVRVHKAERELELWASGGAEPLVLIQTWPICASSGVLGPKLQEGDLQVPEGVYAIDALNPWSSYHLSLRVSYPNEADRARAARAKVGRLGGDIMVHGSCVTIGCIPIEDGPIEELYLAIHDTRRTFGRRAVVDIHIFPARLDDKGLSWLTGTSPAPSTLAFWRDELAPVWRSFEASRRLSQIHVDDGGRYVVGSSAFASSDDPPSPLHP